MFKKFIIGCLITSVILTGCSKNTTDTTSVPKRLTEAETIEALKAINSQYTLVRPEACTGFWGCLGSVLKVAAADITGAASGIVGIGQAAAALGISTGGAGGVIALGVGGAIAGAGASYKAATTQYTRVQPITETFSDMTLTIPLEFNELRNIGFKHNRSIYDVYFGHVEDALLNQYYQGTLSVSSQYLPLLNSDIFLDRNHDMELLSRDYVLNGYNYTTYLNEVVDMQLITPGMRPILSAFMQVYPNMANIGDIRTVINQYIGVVNQSSLTTLERQALIGGLIVASESPYVFYNNVEEE